MNRKVHRPREPHDGGWWDQFLVKPKSRASALSCTPLDDIDSESSGAD
jgi:hypothetical protein